MAKKSQIFPAVKDAVLSVAPNANIILFGSRSRGDYHEESDWDFLILTDQSINETFRKKIRAVVYDVELEFSEAISIILYSKKEWARLEVTPLYQSVEEDGITL